MFNTGLQYEVHKRPTGIAADHHKSELQKDRFAYGCVCATPPHFDNGTRTNTFGEREESTDSPSAWTQICLYSGGANSTVSALGTGKKLNLNHF